MAAISVTIGPYVRGERPAPLVYTFLDSSGTAMNLTGYAADLIIRETDGDPSTLSASVTDPASGQVTYTWTGTEWPTAGHYRAEFVVGNGANRFISILIKFDVRLPVGPVPSI